MDVLRKFFPSILSENEATYFAQLKGIISSVDELCSIQITYGAESIFFRIATSHPKYNNLLIEELLKYHNLFKIRLDMSKSIKTSGTIGFKIKL